MRVCYFIQNHLGPAQVTRLIDAIRRGAKEPIFLVAHDPFAGKCTTSALRAALGETEVFEVSEPVRRGYFSMIRPWFDAVDWLLQRGIGFDWIVYLSAQDYPTQPVEKFEAMLAEGDFDGYLRYWDASDEETPWRRKKQGLYRYSFQYRDMALEPFILRTLRRFNGMQPLVHTHLTYGPRVGVRIQSSPFTEEYRCFGGKQWTMLNRTCAEFALEDSRRRERLMRWFQRTVCPDEAVVQTLLLNANRFRLMNDDLRFADFTDSRDGRPRTLAMNDFERLTDGSSMFARKFDPAVDGKILHCLDSWIETRIRSRI